MSYNEKKSAKLKSPRSSVGNKKSQSRIEALKVTVERKKKCNDKALQIVIDFSEDTVSEDVLLHNLEFINQEHYQDIVEERAINKVCGYPLCSKQLKNIPSQQYHISTTLNKVFDITDRKNFCSNLCYKASKFLKDQVSTSPLWLREEESTTFKLISLQSGGGISGDEIDLGVTAVKLDTDDLLMTSSKILNGDSKLQEVGNESETESRQGKSSNKKESNYDELCNNNENEIGSLLGSSKNLLIENVPSEKNCGFAKFQDLSKKTLIGAKDVSNEEGIAEKNQSAELIEDPESQCVEQESTIETSSQKDNHTSPCLKTDRPSKTQTHIASKSHKPTSTKKSSRVKNKSNNANSNPIQNVVLKIEKILREWISIDTLCFILGKEKVIELLAEKKNQNLPTFTQDVHFYERYLAICRKLNVLELEDTKIDASYRDEAKKPLPDYEALKEEARQMEIKVKMFFKGDKVQFEEPKLNDGSEPNIENIRVEPVLPLVDVHAQKALRRRIVNDKLRKVLQDLQTSLGLRGFNLTEDIRTLVSTLTLSAHNITMKPAEWNLVSIAVIKLLSLRDSLLAQALSSSTSSRHLTLLLMSYTLDSGYLDRLMVWLTDVEAVLQKT